MRTCADEARRHICIRKIQLLSGKEIGAENVLLATMPIVEIAKQSCRTAHTSFYTKCMACACPRRCGATSWILDFRLGDRLAPRSAFHAFLIPKIKKGLGDAQVLDSS
jgi:hypothetical protein